MAQEYMMLIGEGGEKYSIKYSEMHFLTVESWTLHLTRNGKAYYFPDMCTVTVMEGGLIRGHVDALNILQINVHAGSSIIKERTYFIREISAAAPAEDPDIPDDVIVRVEFGGTREGIQETAGKE